MNAGKRMLTLPAAALLIASPLFAGAAPQRTFVSTAGDDTNPCSLTLPCRGFAAAVAAVAAGGEVIVLNSGGYGTVTITQSVSIVAPLGVYAGISVLSGSGITINAGAADIVVLRNLSITGLGGAAGIQANSVGDLRLEGLHVSGFMDTAGDGLQFASPGNLTITKATFEGNFIGIHVTTPASTTAVIVIRDTQLTRNANGYFQDGVGAADATISGTIASGNRGTGTYSAEGVGFGMSGNGFSRVVLESCVASENYGYGAYVSVGTLVLSGNSITGNGTGVQVGSFAAIAQTRGNNTIVQNLVYNVNGTLTPIPGGGT